MKKIARILFAAAAMISVFSACVREPEMIPSAGEQTVLFTAEPIETRTAFTDPTGDSYPVLWTANDKQVKVMLNMTEAKDVDVTPSDDFKTASFVSSFKDTTTYTFFVVSPASAYLSHAEKVSGEVAYRLGVTVPSAQTPTAKSVDEAAQILVAKSETTTGTTAPEKVSLSFKHWTAYGKFSLTNLALGDAKIEAVDLTAEEPWAGRWYYFFADQTSKVNSGSNTITVNTTSASDIWFACAPVDLSGKKLTVKVKTDKGTLTKEITMPADRKFQSGKIACFNVDMKGIAIKESEVYELVSKAEDLLYQSKFIIAAASDDISFAIGTTQNPSNRKAEPVNKENGKIVDPSTAVEVFTLERGSIAGSYAFKTSDGKYIYAAGTTKNNHLKTKPDLDATGSWGLTFNDGYVVVKSLMDGGDAARAYLRYNPNNGNPMFSCYAKDSGVRDSVAIYKLVGSGSEWPVEKKDSGLWLENKSLTVKVGETAEIGIDYEKLDEAYFSDGGKITFTSDDVTIATVDDEGMVLGIKAGSSCTITVTALETAHYNPASKSCKVTVVGDDPTDAPSKTVAEFIAAADKENYYKLTGTVSAFNSSYCSFNLTDDSGTIYVYSVKNKDEWKSVIKDNGTVTLLGKYDYYESKSQHEVIDAVILSFEAGSGPGEVKYEKMDPTNVKEGVYAISYMSSGGSQYIMQNKVLQSYYVQAIAFDLSGSSKPADDCLFTIEKSGDGYTIKNTEGTYVGIEVSGTHYNLKPALSSPYVWTFTAGPDGSVIAKGANSNEYYMSYNERYTEFATSKSTNPYYCPTFYLIP